MTFQERQNYSENCCWGLDLGGTDYKGAVQGVFGG